MIQRLRYDIVCGQICQILAAIHGEILYITSNETAKRTTLIGEQNNC